MKTVNRLLTILAVAAGAGPFAAAQESVSAHLAGRVLLLQGDCGLEGDIEKVGDQYRVRRGSSEVWLPADKGLKLCASWDEAYRFMQKRANLGDPQERLRLAHWCQQHNLQEQALIEAKAALDMRPGHRETRQLVTMLTRPVSPAAKAAAGLVPEPAKPRQGPATSDISADAFAAFATRVQPILMNTCVNCHSAGRGGAFQLNRAEGGQRSLTQANLHAVLAQVRVDSPALSPLLIKAVSAHGNVANAPIKDRQAVPFKALQNWIDALLANNPQLKHQEPEPAVSAAKTAPERTVFAQMQAAPSPGSRPTVISHSTARPELPKDSPATLTFVQDPPKPAINTMAAGARPGPAAPAEQNVNALDAFDPVVFNQLMHPQK